MYLSTRFRWLVASWWVFLVAQGAQAQTMTYTYDGTPKSYTVPAGVTQLQVIATAASGGSLNGSVGGLGGQVMATVPVTAGETLNIILGEQGAGSATATSNAGGLNGGGTGTAGTVLANGAGGGGATTLQRNGLTDDYLSGRNGLVVAGGGGGSGNGGLVAQSSTVNGGAGGNPDGQAGSGTSGGAGATRANAGGNGLSGTGGNGRTGGGGGGGGGYYGGGGGSNGSGGGGGSSWATGLASGVSFAIATTAGNGSLSLTPVTPLPVQLVAFTARRLAAASVGLAWATASEWQNAGFAVERSADGIGWQQVAWVPGAGSSVQAHSYGYTDVAALAGVAYYRLRQVDADGTSVYSPVRSVLGRVDPEGLEKELALQLFPNPAMGPVQISAGDLTAPLRLLDGCGRVVRELPAGTRELDPSGLPAGLYLVQNGRATQRLVISN